MISVLLKKILIKYKIIYAALFLLVVFCVYLSCKGNYSISVKGVEKKYEETFDSLFAGYEGKWTAQKEARLEQMTDKQDALDEQFSQLSYDLLNKKITEDKLYQFVREHKELGTEYDACYKELLSKVDYVQENPDKRYLMKTDGWWYYFTDDTLYYVNLVFVVILCMLVFVGETQTGILEIHRFSKVGEKKFFLLQWGTVVVVAEVFFLITQALKFLIYYVRYGISGMSYPIQSIPVFEYCGWNLSIGVYMALCVGFYMISVLCLCGLAFLLVMILRKGLESVFTIFLLIILPPMCLSEKILCFVPNMYSLMFPANILRGYENNWSFLSLKQLLLYGVVSLVAGAAMAVYAGRKGGRFEG